MYYGLNTNDLVIYNNFLAKVEQFDATDNNRAYLRSDRFPGLIPAVAEWCDKVTLSENPPKVGDTVLRSDGRLAKVQSLNLEKPGYGTVRTPETPETPVELDLKTTRLVIYTNSDTLSGKKVKNNQ